jgi:FKBP-type peptidyl-prolyl cis-trans isomerase SlyD
MLTVLISSRKQKISTEKYRILGLSSKDEPMQLIDSKSVVGIVYTLKGDVGEVLDKSTEEDPFVFLMGVEAIVRGLERTLTGKSEGEEFTVTLQPEDAYGERSPDLIGEVARSQFPPDMELRPGLRFQGEVAGGIRMFTVNGFEGDKVTIDANHELAGKTLNFEVRIVSVRPATAEELSHKHVHHGDGCGHDHGHHHH